MALDTILLVDDEADIRKIGAMSLRAIGKWRVFEATSCAEALAIASRELPDLILLDVMMPGHDGPATLAKLRANAATASIPVVFLTAMVQRRGVESYLALGALGVIGKPFDPMELPREICTIYAKIAPPVDR